MGAKNQNVCDCDQDTAVKISFSAAGLGGVRTNWDAVLWQDRLYVSVTRSQLADGSKRAFVSLLEYAEGELGVSNVVACLDKLHHDNKNVIRNFLSLDSNLLLQGMSFTLQTPMLFASSTLSNMEHLDINLLHHKKQTQLFTGIPKKTK